MTNQTVLLIVNHMRHNLDQTDDHSFKELHSFLSVAELPEQVKQAEITTKEATANLPTESFADRYHRAFPIDSAPNVYVSNAFFMNKKAAIEELWGTNLVAEVEDRLSKAAEIFGIKDDIDRFNKSVMQKAAADYDEQFVASFQIGGTSYELFPYKTADDLVKAATAFNTNVKNYPFGWRTTIATNFVKKAEELGVENLPELVCKYGGIFFPDTRLFQAELERRMHKLSAKEGCDKKYQVCLDKAEKMASRQDALDICAEAYSIEKAAGVYDNDQLYRQMGDIVDKTFTISLYKLAELFNVVEMAGEPYSLDDLSKVSKDIYKEAFGCDIDPSDTSALRDTLPTMPHSDVALFRELSGVKAL